MTRSRSSPLLFLKYHSIGQADSTWKPWRVLVQVSVAYITIGLKANSFSECLRNLHQASVVSGFFRNPIVRQNFLPTRTYQRVRACIFEPRLHTPQSKHLIQSEIAMDHLQTISNFYYALILPVESDTFIPRRR